MAEPQQFKLPDVGEGLTEADVVAWHVKVGDTVEINDLLVEVETAKSVVELPSPFAGVVTAIHVGAGETADVGAPIITIGAPPNTTIPTPPDDKTSAVPPVSESAVTDTIPAPDSLAQEAVEEVEQRHSVLVGYGPTNTKVVRRARHVPAARPVDVASTVDNPNQRPYATPPVRKYARDLGIDLHAVPATDQLGRISRSDVQRYAAQSASTVALGTAEPNETRIPIKGVRKHTAAAMVASAFTAPHATEWVTVDLTRTLKLLARMKADRTFADVRLSPLTLVMRAALLSLRRHPEANAKWDAAAGEIVQLRDVNLGIAAATPRGLLVPNIRSAQSLTTIQLADALTDLVTEARAGRTQPDRMRDGTFTITNIGVFGVDGGTPILNPGEAAILCIGQIRKQPWEHKGRIKLRSTTTLALSFDHRLIDGELGSKVLADIAQVLERPERAFIW